MSPASEPSADTAAIHRLTSLEDLDAATARAAGRPFLIFKHSLTCGRSSWAEEEVRAFVAGPPPGVDVCVVTVQGERDVSNAIEERYRVRHESPQLLLVRGDRVVWHASHSRVTAENIRQAVAEARSGA